MLGYLKTWAKERQQEALKKERLHSKALESFGHKHDQLLLSVSDILETIVDMEEKWQAEPELARSLLAKSKKRLTRLLSQYQVILDSPSCGEELKDHMEVINTRSDPDAPHGSVLEVVRRGVKKNDTYLRNPQVITCRHSD